MARLELIAFIFAAMIAASTQAASDEELPLDVRRTLASGDVQHALPWLENAARAGHLRATVTLGRLYRLGRGVAKDPDKARSYLTSAADAGSADGQYLLAELLQREGDVASAQRWYQAAAAQGHAGAQHRLRSSGTPTATENDIFRIIASQPPSASALVGLDLNTTGPGGTTPLIQAVQLESLAWVEVIANSSDASPAVLNAADDLQNTALHHAARLNNTLVLRALLDAGADPNRENSTSATPLHITTAIGAFDACEILLAHGAKADLPDANGWSPRMIAERTDDDRLRNLLGVGRRAAEPTTLPGQPAQWLIHAALTGNDRLLDQAITAGASPHSTDARGNTALSTAAAAGNDHVVLRLLSEGADTHQAGLDGRTPLMNAAAGGHASALEVLLQHPHDINARDATGRSAMHLTIGAGCAVCVDALLAYAADPDVQDRDGSTPLILAAKRSSQDIALALVDAGSDIEAHDPHGRTALWWAAKTDCTQLALQLLSHGATTVADNSGEAPMHVAVRRNNLTLMNALPRQGVHAATSGGNTPLIVAARHGLAEATSALLQLGADIEVQNNLGDTALITAVKHAARSSTRVLIQAGASINRRNRQNQSARALIEAMDDPAWQELLNGAPSEFELLFGRLGNR